MHFDPATQITDKQLDELNGYIAREKDPEAKPLTANMIKKKEELIAKRDAPPALSKGAKSAVEEIYVEQKFSFRKQIDSKYIQKGHAMENKAIDLICDFFGIEGVQKNETHYSNDYIQGTPDAIKRLGMGHGFQFDIKNVYYPDKLDSFKPNEGLDQIYEKQGKGYNWMLGFDTGFVVKILQNLPEEMMEIEVKKLWKEAGRAWFEEIPKTFRDEVAEFFNFEKLPLEDRIRIFRIDTTEQDKQEIKDAVILSREHFATLDEVWKHRNDQNINFIKELVHG